MHHTERLCLSESSITLSVHVILTLAAGRISLQGPWKCIEIIFYLEFLSSEWGNDLFSSLLIILICNSHVLPGHPCSMDTCCSPQVSLYWLHGVQTVSSASSSRGLSGELTHHTATKHTHMSGWGSTRAAKSTSNVQKTLWTVYMDLHFLVWNKNGPQIDSVVKHWTHSFGKM